MTRKQSEMLMTLV